MTFQQNKLMPKTEACLTNTRALSNMLQFRAYFFLFSMVILFFYRGNFELVSIENGRVNFKEQNEQFLFFNEHIFNIFLLP